MFKSKKIIYFLFPLIWSCTEKPFVTADYQVIPLPQEIHPADEPGFLITSAARIVYPPENNSLKQTALFLGDYIREATGLKLQVTDKKRKEQAIILRTGLPGENKEAYKITVDSLSILIEGAGEEGVFYGVQTLRKAIPVESADVNILLPAVTIEDYPRFGYRGMHLDVGRHLFPVEFIKKYIDLLALHNMNRFHWHLSDDQGWRIEIKKYPGLTESASVRKETLIGHLYDTPRSYDGQSYGGFYTQDEVKEIVAYAAQRFITIIPEIDLPGHMLAALSVYPGLGCTGGPYEVATHWGVFEDVLCAGNEDTFSFLENVFTELLQLFPSEYIHIGGDECPKTRWEACPKCQARIEQEGLHGDEFHSAEEKLQSYFIARVEQFLNNKGRRIIGWDEILEGGIAANATVMAWRSKEAGATAARLGHDAIIVPYNHLYFDYNQGPDKSKEPLSIGSYLPVDKVYHFEPMPEELTQKERAHIIGVQGNLWTEYIPSASLVEYMALPRMDALSELQWLEPGKKEYSSFKERMKRMRKIYDKQGYTYATHIFDE